MLFNNFPNTERLHELFPSILNFVVGIPIILSSYYVIKINIHICMCSNLRKSLFPLFLRISSNLTLWES